MDSISSVHQIIQRNQKRQGLRYSIAFSIGAICGICVAAFLFIVNQNNMLMTEINQLKEQVRPVNNVDNNNKNDVLSIPPPFSL